MSEAAIQPETPSAVFDQLLRLLRAVMAGAATPEQLNQFLQELYPRFLEARDATRERIFGEGPEHVGRFSEAIGRVEESFGRVEEALKACGQFVGSGSEEHGRAAERQVLEAAWAQAMAMDAYGQAELQQGPTRMPLVNMLIRMKEGFVEGRYSRSEFEDSVRGAMRMAAEAQREIQAKERRNPAEDGMIEAYARLERMMQALLSAAGEGPDALAGAIDNVIEAGESVRSAMEELNTRIMTGGPTKMQHANLVLNIMAAHQAEQVPLDVLVRALEVFRQGMEHEAAEVDRMLSLPTQSTAILDQGQRAREAYELHWPALERLEAYAGGDFEQYEPARQALIAASDALAECKAAFEQIGELEGKVLCVKCGAGNAPDARACSKCGARMMQQSNSSSSTLSFEENEGQARGASELVMTENLFRLFEAVNAIAEARIEPDEFADILSWMAELVQEHLLGLPPAPSFSRSGMNAEQVEAVGALEEDLAGYREDVVEGAEEFLTALNRLELFLDDGEKNHLITGVQMVRDAAIRIQKAQAAIDGVAATFEGMKRGAEASPGADQEDEEGSPVG